MSVPAVELLRSSWELNVISWIQKNSGGQGDSSKRQPRAGAGAILQGANRYFRQADGAFGGLDEEAVEEQGTRCVGEPRDLPAGNGGVTLNHQMR